MKTALIVASVLIFAILLPLPEGVDRLACLVLAAIFGYASYVGFHRGRHVVAYPFLAMLVIYQPFFPFSVGQWACVVINVVALAFMLLLLLPPRLTGWLPATVQRVLASIVRTLF